MTGVIDVHGHVWTDERTYPWVSEVTPPGVEKMVYSLENYREEMDRLGVEQAILVATPIHGSGSPYTLECVETDPDTFAGIVLVDADASDAPAQVRSALSHERILGVRLTGEELSAVTTAFWETLSSHEAQVHLLLGPSSLPEAHALVERYPDVTFVFDHLALHPSVHQYDTDSADFRTIADIATFGNAVAKLTHTPSTQPHPFADIHEQIRFFCDEFGVDRLLWGSDYVYHFKKTTPEETLSFLDELPFLSDADREKITRRNALRLLL